MRRRRRRRRTSSAGRRSTDGWKSSAKVVLFFVRVVSFGLPSETMFLPSTFVHAKKKMMMKQAQRSQAHGRAKEMNGVKQVQLQSQPEA